jgi:predicted AAA+ superfamily ATPase
MPIILDEIQVAPDLLAKLRWFAEDLSELPVIAAGSLLEFVLEKHSFSMPVGRISHMHLEPFSFEEFLFANDKGVLVNYLENYQWDADVPSAIHEQLNTYFKEYIIVGGMPAAISNWIQERSLKGVNQVHHELIATYRDDIAKYRGRIAIERVDEVMLAVPKHLGEKFVYTKVNPSVQISTIKHSLDLLCKARICHRIAGCAANGVPLGAEIQDRYLKVIFLDVGLCSAALGLSLDQLYLAQEMVFINRGGIAEQVVGQILRTIVPHYIEPALYYWHREDKNSNAEVDYVVQHGDAVIPIEVKAGSTGSLKSLHVFMGLKKLPVAVRINSDIPSIADLSMKDHQGNSVNYTLLSMPFYLLGQLHRLLGPPSDVASHFKK